jgi:hypothetical protein
MTGIVAAREISSRTETRNIFFIVSLRAIHVLGSEIVGSSGRTAHFLFSLGKYITEKRSGVKERSPGCPEPVMAPG